MNDYFFGSSFASHLLGPALIGGGLFLAVLMFWSLAWQGLALWHAARNKQIWWFIALLLIHTAGVLDIIYLFLYRADRETTPVFPRGMTPKSTPTPEKKNEDSSLPVAESSPAD